MAGFVLPGVNGGPGNLLRRKNGFDPFVDTEIPQPGANRTGQCTPPGSGDIRNLNQRRVSLAAGPHRGDQRNFPLPAAENEKHLRGKLVDRIHA